MNETTFQRVIELMFRAALSAIFIAAGLKHFVRPEAIEERLLAAPLVWLATSVASPGLLVYLTGIVLLAGGIALLLGYKTRLAAIALAIVIVPITISVHVGHADGAGPMLKNIGLFGALLHFAANGSSNFALDRKG
jgi:putative oxidoreductase